MQYHPCPDECEPEYPDIIPWQGDKFVDIDSVGNIGPYAASDGFGVDQTDPVAGNVYDGATGERGPAGKDAEIAITYDGNSVGSLLGISFSKNEGKISFQLDNGQEVTVQGSFTSTLN